jgi:hypothetical protein
MIFLFAVGPSTACPMLATQTPAGDRCEAFKSVQLYYSLCEPLKVHKRENFHPKRLAYTEYQLNTVPRILSIRLTSFRAY